MAVTGKASALFQDACSPHLPLGMAQGQATWEQSQLPVLHFVYFPGHTCWSSAAAFSRVGAWGLNLWSTLCHLHLVHPRAGPWVPEQTTAR